MYDVDSVFRMLEDLLPLLTLAIGLAVFFALFVSGGFRARLDRVEAQIAALQPPPPPAGEDPPPGSTHNGS